MTLPRVAIVDDHELFRSGVRGELADHVDVVGDAGDVADAVALIRTARPDVVLLDVHMPDGGGLAVLRALSEEEANCTRVLALSVSDAPEDVIDLVRAGARGYVTKTISAADLADAVRRVAEGDAVFSPRLAGFVLDAFADAGLHALGGRADGVEDPELTNSPRASATSCASSPVATSTRRSPTSSACPQRPSRPMSPRSCASCSSPIATSSRAGRRSGD